MQTTSSNHALGGLVLVRSAEADGFARVSPQHSAELGLSGEELSSRNLLDWIHPNDRAGLSTVLELGSGDALARHQMSSGEWMPLHWVVKQDPAGTAVVGLTVDEPIQERLPGSIAEEGVTLTDTLEAMARIVEAKNPGMKCSILLLDEESKHIEVGVGPSLAPEYNEAVKGLEIGPMVGSCGTAAYWNVPVVVEDIEIDPLWVHLREAAKLAGVASCWSHPIPGASGEVLGAMALYSSEPSKPSRHHLDGLGIAAKMVGLSVERNRLELRLLQSAKMEALGVLAGGIAHDFNNLLTAVLGNAELVLEGLPTESMARPMVQEIVTTSVSAAELCSQMLAYAGRGTMSAMKIDCNEMVQEIGGLLQVALAKKAELCFELASEDLFASADRSQMRQVIMNLITNASEAIGNNSGTIGIGTSAKTYTRDDLNLLSVDSELKAGEYVHLWVSDTGPGMDAETRAKIFDPFFTTKAAGRGLGLAAVQGIVRRHGGTIVLQGGHGMGTKFSVLLPRVAAPKREAARGINACTKGQGARVLLVEDEDSVRQVIRGMLEFAGYEVLLAEDGEEAIQVFRARGAEIDCVLMDLSMPKLDGDEAFRELKKMRSDVRVILSSGFTEQQILSRFEGQGLAGVVQKPARMHVLLEKIALALK